MNSTVYVLQRQTVFICLLLALGPEQRYKVGSTPAPYFGGPEQSLSHKTGYHD